VHFHSDDDLSVIHMVKQGFGIAVLPELVLRGNAEGVSVLSLSPPLTRTVGFAYNKHSDSIFPALAQFVKFVKENAKTCINNL
jgi:DNA-binding transcriptional LysR family regulator